MEHVLVLVLATLAMFNSASASVQGNTTTLEDFFFERHQESIYVRSLRVLALYMGHVDDDIKEKFGHFSGNVITLPWKKEILQYLKNMLANILSEVASNLGNIAVESIYDDLNRHCAGYLEIKSLTVKPSNVTCVRIRLLKTLTATLNIEAALRKFSRECIKKRLQLCQEVHANCTTVHEQWVGKLLGRYTVEDVSEVGRSADSTPLEIIERFVFYIVGWVFVPYASAYDYLTVTEILISTVPSIQPFSIGNLIHPMSVKEVETLLFTSHGSTRSEQQLTWGIVGSDAGSVGLVCSDFKDEYSWESEEYNSFVYHCLFVNLFQSNLDLYSCVNSADQTSTALTWSTVPSAYFHSQCLCLAYNGSDCGVTAPEGVDPRIYCLSLLLRDFQRQVSFRPAVTYLDYAFKTRVPVCQFANFVQVGFSRDCQTSEGTTDFNLVLSVLCYFNRLVNKHVNCSETRIVSGYNQTELCVILVFMQHVLCDGDVDVEFRVPFYRAGNSPLVLFLTYGDVAVRVLTMVTYLACRQLRNLPGKLLIAYLATTVLRLVMVRATLADMALAVRLDVAIDLASTLWLTSYLHFLTVCIKDLRPPDSLSRGEARTVLLRYSLLGWVLPAALSAAFFLMDETIDSHVQIGQMLFLLCNYMALFANLYMCFINCSFYYDVKNSARKIKKGARRRDVFAAIFNFAIKTSVLSGAGIIIRLIFTQIQGLQELLGYYHALGTVQGLLVFILYGFNHEARAFWLQVFRSLLSRFRLGQNAPV